MIIAAMAAVKSRLALCGKGSTKNQLGLYVLNREERRRYVTPVPSPILGCHGPVSAPRMSPTVPPQNCLVATSRDVDSHSAIGNEDRSGHCEIEPAVSQFKY